MIRHEVHTELVRKGDSCSNSCTSDLRLALIPGWLVRDDFPWAGQAAWLDHDTKIDTGCFWGVWGEIKSKCDRLVFSKGEDVQEESTSTGLDLKVIIGRKALEASFMTGWGGRGEGFVDGVHVGCG